MATNSKDSEFPGTKESALNAENASLILGNENLVTPLNHAAEVTPDPCTPDTFKSPLDFSTVTVEQLGITPESFVKNCSGKSLSYLKKSRRRSTVGVRGSPETNNLIRFIAQQRNLKNAEKSPLTQSFPLPGSPVLHRNVSSLRERISAFQSAFQSIKEKERTTACTDFSEAEEEFKETGTTKKERLGECRQSACLAQSPKRRRRSSQSHLDASLTKAAALQTFSTSTPPNADRTSVAETSADLSEKSSEPGLTQSGCLVEQSLLLSELTEASSGIKAADCAKGRGSGDAVSPDKFAEGSRGSALEVRSLVTPLCKRDILSSKTSVLRSVLKKTSGKLCLESLQEHCDTLYGPGAHPSFPSHPANGGREQKAEDQEHYKVPAFVNMRKRKRVTFGEDLSPEVFDESLPANTPLRKGGTPVRREDLSRISPVLLEQSPVPEQLPQPNFDDKGEDLENIEPLQVSFAVVSPLSKSSVSETLSGTDTFSSSNNHRKIPSCTDGRRTRSSNRRSQLISFAEESVCSLLNTEAQPCKEKKIKRRKTQESKRPHRVPPKKNPILKSSQKKKGRRKKGIQKNLYGERDIASKKPLLSPIPELPEATETPPPLPGVHRVLSDDFSLDGELEERKLPERKNLSPQNSEEFNKYNVSEFCSSYIKSSLSLINATCDQDSSINTIGIHANKIIPKAEVKLESENNLKTATKNENIHISCASKTEKLIVSDGPQSDFIGQSEDGSAAAGQNVENLQSFEISGDVKCEQQDDFLVGPEGKLQTEDLMSGSQKECDYSEDVLIAERKEKSQSEDLGRNSTKSRSGVSCEGKQRRRSMCYLDGQHLSLEKNGMHKPSYSVGSSAEISLENSELCKDLSDSIEQTFQRTNREARVRRSTRLQKDLESEGLVWISLPVLSTSCSSQRIRRRTMHTLDSRGFENVSPREKTASFRHKTGTPCSISNQENSEGFADTFSRLPGKRRKSFCISALADTANTKHKCYKRRSFLSQKGEGSPNDVGRMNHAGELRQ
ncbi:cell division cycle-associated protein 2 isoform X1 [Phyllostomus hastatus]|uniref:cell division cycle-associated protein 2 isoform X1 n=1 Tax=Phyllostomus hastatus TaxID=9423 RepID=UPI001E681E31|nr:cell division cycle-associated protein 2 isoform X1 [Phyllostomus hastatus]XP_045709503.1 cell division cycle-associated protein 2 isoform X1 [Phyllostomus hastatus]